MTLVHSPSQDHGEVSGEVRFPGHALLGTHQSSITNQLSTYYHSPSCHAPSCVTMRESYIAM